MQETRTTKAIILNRKSFRERDSKITVYSLDKGKADLVVRGTKSIKSKLAGHIEPITLANIMIVKGKRLDYLGGITCAKSYKNIKTNLEAVLAAGEAIKIFSKLVKHDQEDKDLFLLLESYLNILEMHDNKIINYNLFLHFFILKLFVFLGLSPEVFSCIECNQKIKPNNNFFDYAKGGVVCNKCSNKKNSITISEDCIKILRFIIKEELDKFNRININNNIAREVIKIINLFSKYNQ